jgi:hypothetical protein
MEQTDRAMKDEYGGARSRKTTTTSHDIEVIQDLQWEEFVSAAKLAPAFSDIEAFRSAIVEEAFAQPSYRTRFRYASYFIKWFLPSVSFAEPTVVTWRAFRDDAALRHVMRWQYITSNPPVAAFVDGPFSAIAPGQPIDDAVDGFLVSTQGGIKDKTKNRLRTNLRKIGIALPQGKAHYRIVPEVSPKAVAVLLAWLFAQQPQMLSLTTLLADPWWKRLGIVDESMLRSKLRETAAAGLITRMSQVDTLDQVTTKYSLEQFESGKLKR